MDHPLSRLWLTWLTISWGRGATGNLRGPVACREWRAVDVMHLGWLLPFVTHDSMTLNLFLVLFVTFFFPLSRSLSLPLLLFLHIYCTVYVLYICHLHSDWPGLFFGTRLLQVAHFLILLPPAPQRLELFAKVQQGWEEIHSLSFLMFSIVRGFS